MSALVLVNAEVYIGGVNFSSYIRQISVNRTTTAVDVSTMGSRWAKTAVGTHSWEVSATFQQDLAAGALEAILQTVFALEAPVQVEVLGTSSPMSASNPRFSGQMVLTDSPLLDGDWGSASEVGITLVGNGVMTNARS